ncbi:MAG: DUF2905 domain-containing protein [Saprospiraceae bacterium]|nr:DUF2905 domain-containing protein [Saprospiraceae bacterium]
MQDAGKWLVIIGALILGLGMIFYFWGDKFQWIGHLPGDIRIERDNFKFYFPMTTMVLFSIVLNVVIRLVKWITVYLQS